MNEDGWITCDFTSFLTVFQTYKDDERVIMKEGAQWYHILDRKYFRLQGVDQKTSA